MNNYKKMTIPKGTQLWKIKSKYEANVILASPQLLIEAAYEYFAWCDKHPLSKPEAVKSGQECGRIIDVPLRRPYSLKGFCLYIGCSSCYLKEFKKKGDSNILEIIARIEDIIHTQLLEGAVSGIFNTSIVSRLLGEIEDEGSLTDRNNTVFHIEVIDPQAKEQLLLLKERLSA
ncbi:terminase small subunit [Dysgonomonas macrotermitis]|nr:terminase small subunit [Dysgonomonas macrotermitis]